MTTAASTEALSLRRIAAALRSTTLLPSFPTLPDASTRLFMATMEFYHQHRELTMPKRLTSALTLLHQAPDTESLARRAILAIEAIEESEAVHDQTVQSALSLARLVLGVTR